MHETELKSELVSLCCWAVYYNWRFLQYIIRRNIWISFSFFHFLHFSFSLLNAFFMAVHITQAFHTKWKTCRMILPAHFTEKYFWGKAVFLLLSKHVIWHVTQICRLLQTKKSMQRKRWHQQMADTQCQTFFTLCQTFLRQWQTFLTQCHPLETWRETKCMF